MEKATLNAAIQRNKAREDFAHSAENRRKGPERELTHAKRDDGTEFRQKRARSAVPKVDAHRVRYAAAVAIQAAVMSKAARALIALHEELHDDVRQVAGNTTTANGTPSASAATGSATGRTSTLSSPSACASRPTPWRSGVVLL